MCVVGVRCVAVARTTDNGHEEQVEHLVGPVGLEYGPLLLLLVVPSAQLDTLTNDLDGEVVEDEEDERRQESLDEADETGRGGDDVVEPREVVHLGQAVDVRQTDDEEHGHRPEEDEQEHEERCDQSAHDVLRLADVQIVPQYRTRRRSRAHTSRKNVQHG